MKNLTSILQLSFSMGTDQTKRKEVKDVNGKSDFILIVPDLSAPTYTLKREMPTPGTSDTEREEEETFKRGDMMETYKLLPTWIRGRPVYQIFLS